MIILYDPILPSVLSSGFAESSTETTYFAPYPIEEPDAVDDYDYSSDSDLEDDTDALYDDWEVELPQPPATQEDAEALVPSEVLASDITGAEDTTAEACEASPASESGGTDATLTMPSGPHRTSKGNPSFPDLMYHPLAQIMISPLNKILGLLAAKSSSKTQHSSRMTTIYSRLILRLTL